jgi:hypothetical protein
MNFEFTFQLSLARVKTPSAIFQFDFSSHTTGQVSISSFFYFIFINSKFQQKSSSILCEMSHEELYRFYENIESIQDQLDMLS